MHLNSTLAPASEPLSEMSEQQYAAYRYELGVPEGVNDIAPNEAFPLESNFDYLNGGMGLRSKSTLMWYLWHILTLQALSKTTLIWCYGVGLTG